MDDEVIVIAEGINGTVMKINELQVKKQVFIRNKII
jgi:hypothetical protein